MDTDLWIHKLLYILDFVAFILDVMTARGIRSSLGKKEMEENTPAYAFL
jgi:hypothetical protein